MRGKDGLFVRENGIFAFRFKNSNGKWLEKSSGKTKRSDAREVKRRFLEDFKKGAAPTPLAKMPVSKAADQWLESYRGHIDPRTVRSYRTTLNAIKRHFGDRKMESITVADLHGYQTTRLDAGKHPTTVNHELMSFSFCLKEAGLWERLARKYKPLKNSRHSTRQPLSNDQLNRLVVTAMGNPRFEVVLNLMLTAANTTCRPCEIAALQLGRIHVDGDFPHIAISRATTKTNSGERLIPLNRVALLAIRRLLDRAHRLGASEPGHFLLPAELARHTRPESPLHERRREGGFDPSYHQRGWGRTWRKLREKAGLPDVEFYSLRHTSITAAGEQNVPLAVVQSLAGHMDGKMTEYYTSIRDNPKVQAVRAIEAANPQLLVLLGIESGRAGDKTQ
jgi:integrase